MTDTLMVGTYRLVHKDANDIVLNTMLEMHSIELGAGGTAGAPQTDLQRMITLMKNGVIIGEDEKLVIQFKPDADVTEAAAANAHTKTYKMPITFRNLRSRQVFEKDLNTGHFTTARATAVSQVWNAGQWVDADIYTVPAQSAIVLGHRVTGSDARTASKIRLQFDVVTT
ncbi:hypothetical protein ES707_11339 [subsurface metagenome]